MKIGIITFHAAFNYGSMLQAYALQTFLENLGHDVEIINFRSKTQKESYQKPIQLSSFYSLKCSIYRLIHTPRTLVPLYKKWHLFDNFLHNNLHLTKEYTTIEELKNADFDYDVLITGSDQIWNYVCGDFSEAYFGNFVSNQTRKIAYAISLGPDPESKDGDFYKKNIKGFQKISAREIKTKRFLEEKGICKDVDLVLDPTMLLSAKDYNPLMSDKPLIEGNYLFYYTPYGKKREISDEAIKIAREKDLAIVCDNFYDIEKKYNNIRIYAAVGPSEFLNLVRNATVVCGESFHLMVFSIIFEKEFYCIHGDEDSRIQNLAHLTGLKDRLWSLKDKRHNSIHPYKGIKSKELFQQEREKSISFLVNNIG